MPGLLTTASLYNSILFYFAFDERVKCVHVAGMLVMTVGIVFLGLESGGVKSTTSVTTNSLVVITT